MFLLKRSGNSSAGRARPCQGRGREFESRFPLQIQAVDQIIDLRLFFGLISLEAYLQTTKDEIYILCGGVID